MISIRLTRALEAIKVDVWPNMVVAVRMTCPDDTGAPQGTLIVTTAAPPDNRIVVGEAVDIVVQLINAQTSRVLLQNAPEGLPAA